MTDKTTAERDAAQFTACDMATASAQGFRDGRASLPLPGAQEAEKSLQAVGQEPVAWLYDWVSEESRLTDWITTNHAEAHAPGNTNIRPLYAAQVLAGWQPIETAPKDGTELLLWREDCGQFIGSYTSADGFPLTQDEIDAMDEETLFTKDWFTQWPDARRLDGSEAPTHWQPLPVEPSMDGESNADQA